MPSGRVFSGSSVGVKILSGSVGITGTPNVAIVTHASKISGYVSQTTATNVIVITSGANTIYVQDIVISVETAMSVTLFSAATVKLGPLYFATQGGVPLRFVQPMVLNTNQSLTVTPSASGTCSVFAGGYTVV